MSFFQPCGCGVQPICAGVMVLSNRSVQSSSGQLLFIKKQQWCGGGCVPPKKAVRYKYVIMRWCGVLVFSQLIQQWCEWVCDSVCWCVKSVISTVVWMLSIGWTFCIHFTVGFLHRVCFNIAFVSKVDVSSICLSSFLFLFFCMSDHSVFWFSLCRKKVFFFCVRVFSFIHSWSINVDAFFCSPIHCDGYCCVSRPFKLQCPILCVFFSFKVIVAMFALVKGEGFTQ